MSNLALRTLTALILGIIALLVSWQGGWLFACFSLIIGVGILKEWTTLCQTIYNRFTKILSWLLYVVFSCLVFYSFNYSLIFIFIAVCILAIFSHKKLFYVLGGFLYATLPVYALVFLRNTFEYGFFNIIFLFTLVWGTDIGAYFIGKFFGGPKLSPRFSPKKTWSGAIGGALISIICSVLLSYFWMKPPVISQYFIALVFFLSASSQIGDIFESMLKRKFGVKDSGNILPGHGGVMDRVDGLIFAAVLLALIQFIQNIYVINLFNLGFGI